MAGILDVIAQQGMGAPGPQFQPPSVGAPPVGMLPQTGYKPEGGIGAVVYGQNRDNYMNMMQQQQQLNDLALQGEAQRIKEYQAGAPLRATQRDLQFNVLQGMAPYGSQLGSAHAQASIAEQEYNRQAKFGKSAIEDKLREYRDNETQSQWKRRGMAFEGMYSTLAAADEIRKTQGPQAAIEFMKTQRRKYADMGLDMPDEQYMSDPKNWTGLMNISRLASESFRKLDLEYAKLASNERVAKTNSALGKNWKPEDYERMDLMNIRNKILSGAPVTKQEQDLYKIQVTTSWYAIEKEMTDRWLQANASPDNPLVSVSTLSPAMKQRLYAWLKQLKQQFFQTQYGNSTLGAAVMASVPDAYNQVQNDLGIPPRGNTSSDPGMDKYYQDRDRINRGLGK